jgi:ribosomal protein L31
MSAAALLGSWKLVAFKRRFSDTGEEIDVMGPDPHGVITLGADGRMSAVITAGSRSAETPAAELFGTLMAYSGRYSLEDDRFVTDVDVAWHPAWVGSKQVRYFEVKDGELHITTAEQTHPAFPGRLGRGLLIWRRDPLASSRT